MQKRTVLRTLAATAIVLTFPMSWTAAALAADTTHWQREYADARAEIYQRR